MIFYLYCMVKKTYFHIKIFISNNLPIYFSVSMKFVSIFCTSRVTNLFILNCLIKDIHVAHLFAPNSCANLNIELLKDYKLIRSYVHLKREPIFKRHILKRFAPNCDIFKRCSQTLIPPK